MSAGRMIYLAAPAVCLATQATAAEFAVKLDADRATLGGPGHRIIFALGIPMTTQPNSQHNRGHTFSWRGVRGSVGGPTVNFSPRPQSPPSW
jgi:hypothetical protein